MENSQDSCYPRDLLQRFTRGGGGNRLPAKPKEEAHERPAKVELSLGLSLNGRFGMEPQKMVVDDNRKDNKLFRASSVTDFVNIPVDVELSLCSPLTRTCSLPPETEAEWRKRKELQSLRRSEAKRKRVEKLKNVGMVKGKTRENRIELFKQSPPSPSPSSSPPPPPPPPPPPLLAKFSSQGSIGSQGSGGSSGISDLDSQPFHDGGGRHDHPNARSLNGQSMPCVSTKGDGVDGKKIQGFLYRYEKGEVKIVCVCHGTFLTPAEFVKHGGGTTVDHPLRHIIVNSSFLT